MLVLSFYHHNIHVQSNESLVIEKIKEEFHYFVTDKKSSTFLSMDLISATPPEIPTMVAKKILEHVTIYELGPERYLEYADGPVMICHEQKQRTQIYATDTDRLYELAFLTIHSLIGQKLEESGMGRLHAMAISIGNNNIILMLPSKGGKSTLLSKMLEDPSVKIISDDMPLCDLKGRIYPFPSKIGLDQIPLTGPLASRKWNKFKRHHYPDKWALSLSQFTDRLDQNPMEKKNFLMAGFRLSSKQGLIQEVSGIKMISPLVEHMIIGLGLPQIIEMFLKFKYSDGFKLLRHGIIRSRCAFHLVKKSRCFHIYLGKDIGSNVKLIKGVIRDWEN